jgi:hypothetical protein
MIGVCAGTEIVGGLRAPPVVSAKSAGIRVASGVVLVVVDELDALDVRFVVVVVAGLVLVAVPALRVVAEAAVLAVVVLVGVVLVGVVLVGAELLEPPQPASAAASATAAISVCLLIGGGG